MTAESETGRKATHWPRLHLSTTAATGAGPIWCKSGQSRFENRQL